MKLTAKALETTKRKCAKGKLVCPHCHPDNVELEHRESGRGKMYTCEDNHLVDFIMFSNGYINMWWGDESDEFENLEMSSEELCIALEEGNVICPRCKKELLELDDSPLLPPQAPAAKTKVYVGDIWDKAKCPQATKSDYDKDGNFQESAFDKANKRRMADMRRGKINVFDDATGKQKTIRRTRVNEPQGTPITKPTKPS
jgi:hypothetical protein